MAKVDLYVQNSMWTVGQDWFLHSFFSTIAYRLEPNGWGPTPWQVPPGAKSLADCFLTSSANNLLDTIERVLEFSLEANANVEIHPFGGPDRGARGIRGRRGPAGLAS